MEEEFRYPSDYRSSFIDPLFQQKIYNQLSLESSVAIKFLCLGNIFFARSLFPITIIIYYLRVWATTFQVTAQFFDGQLTLPIIPFFNTFSKVFLLIFRILLTKILHFSCICGFLQSGNQSLRIFFARQNEFVKTTKRLVDATYSITDSPK